MIKCSSNYKVKNGKCVKKKNVSGRIKSSGILGTQIFGLLLLGLSFLVWYMRPLNNCSWWNILCKTGGVVISPIYMIATVLLLLGGISFILKLDKLIF